ncbi:hypothetical protein GVN23_05510 [Sphingobium yanoikuyae]|nr:hypothetical protein [Sphingobium yanoikuyae]
MFDLRTRERAERKMVPACDKRTVDVPERGYAGRAAAKQVFKWIYGSVSISRFSLLPEPRRSPADHEHQECKIGIFAGGDDKMVDKRC